MVDSSSDTSSFQLVVQCFPESLRLPKVHISSSYPCSLGQEFTVRHCDVPQVPKDPKHQTKKDDDRSRQDEKVPKTDRCKNTNEEENQSDYVEQNGQEEKDAATSHSFLAVHLGEAQVRRADRRTAS